MSTVDPARAVNRWLADAVIGLNLCPFAAQALRTGGIRIHIATAADAEQSLGTAIDELLAVSAEDAAYRTTLVVFPNAMAKFDDFLDLIDQTDTIIDKAGLRGKIQLAHFHPDYVFAGVPKDDPSHWTNRAPYPILHFLREDDVAKAIANYPGAATIPDRNIARLAAMSLAEIQRIIGGSS